MRRSKEIIILFALLVGAMAFVLWYVIDRRAKNRRAPPALGRVLAPVPTVEVTIVPDQTIDFSSGRPVVKDDAENRAALAAAAKDIAEAIDGLTFKAAPPPPAPAVTPAPAAVP
jgi:hypothetical protein